jgi:hypothetical protein
MSEMQNKSFGFWFWQRRHPFEFNWRQAGHRIRKKLALSSACSLGSGEFVTL